MNSEILLPNSACYVWWGNLKKRVKIEIEDGFNEKVTITLEGTINKEKIQNLIDIIQLMGVSNYEKENIKPEDISKFDKVLMLIERKFPAGWFTSQDIMVAYEDQYDEPIGLSTVSTYLARLINREIISKSGGISTRRYKLNKVENSKHNKLLQEERDNNSS